MTIAFWCVLVAGFLPYFGTLTAKIGGERFDNSNPRDWLNAQSGFRKRANAAQHNSFEAFPFFAAAVIIAHLAGAPQGRIDLFAVLRRHGQETCRATPDCATCAVATACPAAPNR